MLLFIALSALVMSQNATNQTVTSETVTNQTVYNSACRGTIFCAYAGPASDGNTTIVTVHSAANGWAGFGIGQSMAGASLFVAWKNSTGGIVIVNSKSEKKTFPTPLPQQNVFSIPLQVPAPQWAKFSFSFACPSIGNASDFLLASSDIPPTGDLNSINAQYQIHTHDHEFKAAFAELKSGQPLDVWGPPSASPSPPSRSGNPSEGHTSSATNNFISLNIILALLLLLSA